MTRADPNQQRHGSARIPSFHTMILRLIGDLGMNPEIVEVPF